MTNNDLKWHKMSKNKMQYKIAKMAQMTQNYLKWLRMTQNDLK